MSGVMLWTTIALAGLLTFVLRWSFIALVDSLELPVTLRAALRFVPAAVLSAIVWPAVLVAQNSIAIEWSNLRLWAVIIAALVAGRTRNVIYTVAAGLGALWLLTALFG